MTNLVSNNGGSVHMSNTNGHIACGDYNNTERAGFRSATKFVETTSEITCKRCIKVAAPLTAADAKTLGRIAEAGSVRYSMESMTALKVSEAAMKRLVAKGFIATEGDYTYTVTEAGHAELAS